MDNATNPQKVASLANPTKAAGASLSAAVRPRPGSFGEHISVLSHILVNSFLSGHTEHDVASYGFLLYLSLTSPVSQWRYQWILVPFQIFAVLDILTIGIRAFLKVSTGLPLFWQDIYPAISSY